jgi:hypothetical protein
VSSTLRGDEAELGSSDHGAERRPTARLAEFFRVALLGRRGALVGWLGVGSRRRRSAC